MAYASTLSDFPSHVRNSRSFPHWWSLMASKNPNNVSSFTLGTTQVASNAYSCPDRVEEQIGQDFSRPNNIRATARLSRLASIDDDEIILILLKPIVNSPPDPTAGDCTHGSPCQCSNSRSDRRTWSRSKERADTPCYTIRRINFRAAGPSTFPALSSYSAAFFQSR